MLIIQDCIPYVQINIIFVNLELNFISLEISTKFIYIHINIKTNLILYN